ncbi:ADP-ribosylglycohydrolase family protein [Pseudaestuariivita sp.]|uniref:ADP-ribosylglycohydrolase family protein n=1 Tax=Pseudaestuariivita sp. TaxID=2211669 RepID=UPI004058989B
MQMTPKATDMLLGALVADAAARGLHWLYDPARIAEVAESHGSAAFVPIDHAHYADVPGVAVHAPGTDGQQTQYGEVLLTALRVVRAKGGFDVTAFQDAYAAHFGPGGTYVGYIDRPTRGTLDNLHHAVTDPSGVDDDQLPALATLPAVLAAHHGQAEVMTTAQQAIRVTNVHEAAERYGAVAVGLLSALLDGTSLKDALASAAAGQGDLETALGAEEADSVAYGETTGRACHLHQGVPLVFHILTRSGDYAEAVERNIRAGGDSAGRSILLGAAAALACGQASIPTDWIRATHAANEVKGA